MYWNPSVWIHNSSIVIFSYGILLILCQYYRDNRQSVNLVLHIAHRIL